MNRRHFLTDLLFHSMIAAAMVAVVVLPISAQEPPPEPRPTDDYTVPQTGYGAPQGEYVPGELLVKFKPEVSNLSAQNALRAEGLRTLEVSAYSGVMRVQVVPGSEAQAMAALQAQKNVEFVTYNYLIQALGDPNDFYYGLQWALNQAADHDIDAPEAWDVYTGGSDVIIAVIDTGVDLDHPDLQAKIVAGYDYVNGDNDPDDDHYSGHGTHVAGIAAAVGNNGVGIAGVSWGARIMPLKVLDSGGNGNTFNLSQAVYYAVDHGARVINMSLGAQGSTGPCGWYSVENAFNYAVNHGVLLAVASGNDGQNGVNCPGAYDQAMAVGSTTSSDTRSSFSNYGPRLDIAAPGSNIYSTLPVYQGSYGYKDGTSMATPHVAGLAALIWSSDPSLTLDEVRDVIQSTAEDLGDPGRDDYFGYGRINAWRALESLISLQSSPERALFFIDDDSPVPASRNAQITTDSASTITWTTTISPPVSWLSVGPPVSGTVSAASPSNFTLAATRPVTYGTYITTVVVTGTAPSGVTLGPATTEARVTYAAELYQYIFPRIFKNYAP